MRGERGGGEGRIAPGPDLLLGHLPHLFEAHRVRLRLRVRAHVKLLHERLAARPAAALGEQRLASAQLAAALEAVFQRAVLCNADVARRDPRHAAILVIEDFRGCETRIYLDAKLLRLFTKPANELPEADNVVALVVLPRARDARLKIKRRELVCERLARTDQLRREQEIGQRERARLGQQHKGVLIHRGLDRRTSLFPVRDQLIERARLKDVPRQNVRANLGALLDNAHAEVLARLERELLQSDRGREPGRAGTDRDDIVLHYLARLVGGHIAQAPRGSAMRPRGSSVRPRGSSVRPRMTRE